MGALSGVMTGLNTVTSVISTINTAANAIGSLTHDPERQRRENLRAQQNLALRQLQQEQRLQEANRAEQAALEREKIAADTESAERERRDALRRAVARQRAAFGAQGVGSGSGSSEAVLLGLFEESDDDRVERERLDDLRNRFISQDLSEQSRINVLQRSQLAEKQKLERIVKEG